MGTQLEQAKGKRGKPARKPAKKTESTDKRLEQIAAKAAASTIAKMNREQEARASESTEEDEEISSSLSNIFGTPGLDETETDTELVGSESHSAEEIENEMGDFDIFEFGAGEAARRGDMPKFRIYRSGEFLCVKYGQYSYERLQKEYKGGHYKIYAYSNVSNKYLKAQSKMIADPFVESAPHQEQQTLNQNNNVADMINAMKDIFSTKTQGEAEEIRAKSDSTATQMTMMMTMMQQQFQMQMQMVQQQSKESQRMIELMLTLNANKPKEDKGMNTMELIALLEKSKSKGAAEFKELFSMAKELAEDMRGESQGEGGEEKAGLLDSVIKGIAPLLASMNQPQAQQPQPQQQQLPRINPQIAASVPTRPTMIQPQAGIPQTMSEVPQGPKPIVAQPVPAGPLGVSVAEVDEDDEDEYEDEFEAGEAEEISELKEGESYVELPRESEKVEKEVITVIKRQAGPMAPVKEKEKEVDEMTNIQSKVMELLAGDLVQGVIMRRDPVKVAAKSYEKLAKNGVTSKMILDNFSQEIILKTAKEKGLPEQYEPMLKDFYANIETLCKRDLNSV